MKESFPMPKDLKLYYYVTFPNNVLAASPVENSAGKI